MPRFSGSRLPSLFVTALAAVALLAAGPLAAAQCPLREQLELDDPSPAALDRFGASVASDGGWLAVSAPGDDGAATDAGAIEVFLEDASGWQHAQTLIPSNAAQGDQLRRLAMRGDVLVAGVSEDDLATAGVTHQDAGSAVVFRLRNGRWVEQQRLLPPAPKKWGRFGFAVDTDARTIVIGELFGDGSVPSSGIAHTFVETSTGWVATQRLQAPDATSGAHFGISVAIDAGVVLVGATRAESALGNGGAAYWFRETGAGWVLEHLEHHDDTGHGVSFGRDVDVEGDRAIVAVDTLASSPGHIRVYEHDGRNWILQQELAPSLPPGDFAVAARLSRDAIAVAGSTQLPGRRDVTSTVHLFRRHGPTWHEEAVLWTAAEEFDITRLGLGLCFLPGEPERIAAGAEGQGADDAGAAFVYRIPPLLLGVEPGRPKAGEAVDFEVCGGRRGGLVLLATALVDGAPAFHRITIDTFRPGGVLRYSGTVPPGLEGLTVSFQAHGIDDGTQQPRSSNRQRVRFR